MTHSNVYYRVRRLVTKYPGLDNPPQKTLSTFSNTPSQELLFLSGRTVAGLAAAVGPPAERHTLAQPVHNLNLTDGHGRRRHVQLEGGAAGGGREAADRVGADRAARGPGRHHEGGGVREAEPHEPLLQSKKLKAKNLSGA